MQAENAPTSPTRDPHHPTPISERLLVRAWQRGFGRPLRTTDGRDLSIVFRGRCVGGAGPDIRGALLAFDGGHLVEGDVEFHVRAADWRAHRHDRDPRYRAVVLHVVLRPDGPAPPDARGEPLPTLALSPDDLVGLTERDGDEPPGPAACHRQARERGTEHITATVDRLGDRRLAAKAARLEAELTRHRPEGVAYETLGDALGFSQNREPFARLVRAVPIALLGALLGRRAADDALLLAEAILFGVAGLLPSQRRNAPADWEADQLARDLEAAWALYRADWDGFGLAVPDWTFGGVRAANYPTRRVAALARLVVHYRAEGLDAAFLAPLRARPTPSRLERIFILESPDDYWATHADFGVRLPGPPAALLGQERARDAVVNVAFPLALAIAAQTGDRALADAAWDAYRSFPRPTVYGVTRTLAGELGLAAKLVATARRQQGLLYLSRNHCERAACERCPLASGG
jgi:hypothetical protein